MINVKFIVLFICVSNIGGCCCDYCRICPSHTLCMYKRPGPGPYCRSYDETALITKEDVETIVNKINQRRNFVALGLARNLPSAANMNQMRWSEELALFAQRWADQCDPAVRPDRKDLCRDLVDTKVGQSIATVMGLSPGLSVKSFVEMWYMQALDYNGSVTYYNQSEGRKTDDFTQLIWAETTLVGCGKARFNTTKAR
ncbi:venom allergen 3-like isoform X2 [Cydia splendana]|uniref:venom allergen 3-like isoform X2 n=1 Tax=Cydia splendana TaxID=1100963 RepID=UPI00300CF7D3